MLGNFSCFCCHLLTFFENRLFQNILQSVKLLNSDQDPHSVYPDLSINYLQGSSADDKVAVEGLNKCLFKRSLISVTINYKKAI